ncbi:MAG TPA: hypothetical protein VFF31_22510 [Blastocatellia bacterium]|nr:hypothetical protein [Blastocatellia bacterium]
MHTDARTRLAASQQELVRALMRIGPAPAGFDAFRIQATADVLLLKRTHEVARAWPALAQSLGSGFDERFADYARSRLNLHEAGPLADGREFARALAGDGALTDDAAIEALAFDLRCRVDARGVITLRSLSFGASILKQPRRLVVAVRLPVVGERWIKIPLKIL